MEINKKLRFLGLLFLLVVVLIRIQFAGKITLAQTTKHWSELDFFPDHLINTLDVGEKIRNFLNSETIIQILKLYGCPWSGNCSAYLNPVFWTTDYAYLQASDFYMNINGVTYYGTDTDLFVRSDPGGPYYTTLEVSWQEHGKEMRLFIYFYSDGEYWYSNEIRTYNGADYGDWLYYQQGQPFFKTPLGEKFTGTLTFESNNLETTGYGGQIYFTDLQLQAFLPLP